MTDEAHDYQNGSDSDLGQNSEIARAEETHRQEYIDYVICGELDERIQQFNSELTSDMDKEAVVEQRIKQLSLAKVMVTIHKKSTFLLVCAHSQLGEAYINNQCYEMALEHLTVALKYNGELLNSVAETKDYHIHLLTMLGRCYLEAGSPKEALNLLQKSYEMSQSVQDGNFLSQASILQLIAKSHLALHDFEKALELLMQSGEILSADEENTDLLEHRSFVYVEIADLLKKKGLLTEAIDFKVRAFEFLEVYPKLSSSDTVAELACSLGTWLEEDNQITEGLAKLEKALEIYVQKYGAQDQRSCRVKRRIALIYLRCNQFDQALEELREVAMIERTVFGDNSVSLAKTLKVIGTLLIVSGSKEEARQFLFEALLVFELRGQSKLVKETQLKLKQLNKPQTGLINAIAEQVTDEIAQQNESGQDGDAID